MAPAFRRCTVCRVWNHPSIKKFIAILLASIVCFAVMIHFKMNYMLEPKHETEATKTYFSNLIVTEDDIKAATDPHNIFPLVYEVSLKPGESKFANEEARVLGFPMYLKRNITKFEKNPPKIIFLATPYFGEWNPRHYYFPHFGSTTFTRYRCPISNCHVTNDKRKIQSADAVLFHVRDVVIYKFPTYRHPSQIWILYSMEPPWLEVLDVERFNGLINWTMSYRKGSDVQINYGFIGRKPGKTLISSASNSVRIRRINLAGKYDKAVWFASNCCTDSGRERFVFEIKKYYDVDVLGGCGNEGCRPAETKKCYQRIAKRYKFYLAFENAICQSYVTEKLYNVLEYDIIPVVFGGANYSSITPPNSVIIANDFESPRELAEYLRHVSKNNSLYRSFFEWKETYRAYLQPWMCNLCEKLHQSPVVASVKRNLSTWWNEEGSCRKWTESGLKPVDNPAFPCYHTRIFQ